MSPVLPVLLYPPVQLMLIGLCRGDFGLLGLGMTASAGLFGTAPTLLDSRLADRVDSWVAQTTFAVGHPERCRKRVKRRQRYLRPVAWAVGSIDLLVCCALVRATVDPVHGRASASASATALAFLCGLLLLLGALLGTAWVISARAELRRVQRQPTWLSPDPVIRSKDVAARLDREVTSWLAWVSGSAAILCAVAERLLG